MTRMIVLPLGLLIGFASAWADTPVWPKWPGGIKSTWSLDDTAEVVKQVYRAGSVRTTRDSGPDDSGMPRGTTKIGFTAEGEEQDKASLQDNLAAFQRTRRDIGELCSDEGGGYCPTGMKCDAEDKDGCISDGSRKPLKTMPRKHPT